MEAGHLYVHIPFCHRICPYCSFYKHQPGATDTAAFLQAVNAEARDALERYPECRNPRTIYFGGGTPTLLSTAHLERWLPEFMDLTGMSRVEEWTVEVNPRTITPAKAQLLRHCGVTRVSLGIQSWDPPVLETLGRDHAPEDAEQAFHILRDAGFPVVNIDLMFSVPGQSLESWQETLHRTLALEPDHVSAYNLTYEEDTAFFEKHQRGEFRSCEQTDEAFFATVIDTLEGAGFRHYETSNYSRPGCESLHNQSYWAGEEYLGLGPGAVSTLRGRRWKNVENTTLYMSTALAGDTARGSEEEITRGRWDCERIALELRTARGVPMACLPEPERADDLITEGLALRMGDRLVLTRRGKFLTDPVAAHLWV